MKKYLILTLFALLSAQCHRYTKINMKHKFNFYTEYHQFYIEDSKYKSQTDPLSFWDEEAFLSGLAIDNGILGISTKSYGNIKGEIEILDKPNDIIKSDLYDHIVEGGINIESGELQILSCTSRDIGINLKVPVGKYRIRIYGSNFASVKEPDLANDTDNDYYRIELWKSDDMERKVLKKYDFNQ